MGADQAAWLERLAITVSELLMLCACSPDHASYQNHQSQMQTTARIFPSNSPGTTRARILCGMHVTRCVLWWF